MKIALIALLVGVCSLAIARPSAPNDVQGKIADKIFLAKQKDLLRLLRHVHQPNAYKDQVGIANSFDFESNIQLFDKPIAVKEFIQIYRAGLLPHKEIFSIYNEVHRRQVIALFHVLYYAKNYETFYKVSCWAREFVNPGMYVYALTVAVLHRPDCRGLVLPAPYEIYPYYFINHEVIKQAQEYKMQNWAYLKPEVQQRLENILDSGKYQKYIQEGLSQGYYSGNKYQTPSSKYYIGKEYVQQPYVQQQFIPEHQKSGVNVPYQQVPYKSYNYYSQKPSFLRDYIQPLIGKTYQQSPYEYQQYDYVPKYQSSLYQGKQYYEQTPYAEQYQGQKSYGSYQGKQYYEQTPYAEQYQGQKPYVSYQGKQYYEQKPYVEQYQGQTPYVSYQDKQYYEQNPNVEQYQGQKQYVSYQGKQYYEQKPYVEEYQSQKPYVPYQSKQYYEQTPYFQEYQGQKSYLPYQNKQYDYQTPYQAHKSYGPYLNKPYVSYENQQYGKQQYYENTPYTSYQYGQHVPEQYLENYVNSGVYHTVEDGVDVIYIPANYTTRYPSVEQEQVLSYFTEDIGLNSYYYYFHADYPFWMTGTEYGLNKDRRGELFFYTHQQLLARYYLERLSNGLGEIEWINVEEPVEYVCNLQYENGLPFPIRPAKTDLVYDDYTKYSYERINILEKRILEAIDLGYVLDISGNKIPIYTPEGTNILGNLISGNADSVNRRYYGHLIKWAKILLGFSGKPLDNYQLQPSTLELYETALRDPMFYRIYKRIVEYFLYYKKNLPSYSYNDLVYQGVKIDSVFFDQLITYFDYFNIELNNAIYNDYTVDSEVPQVLVKAKQIRLNHKPFNYRINVSSDKAAKAVVRLFLGPKYDSNGNQIRFEENRVNFVELDKFVYDLQSGQNVIVRDSRNLHHIVQDRTSYYDLYRKVLLGLKGEEPFVLDNSEAHCGFPQRLLLPKGTPSGLTYQVFVVVTPYQGSYSELQDEELEYTCGIGSGARFIDNLPLGYPLDREIDVSQFYTPNMYFQDVVIYHQPEVGTVVPQVPQVSHF